MRHPDFIWNKRCMALDLATLTGIAHNWQSGRETFRAFSMQLIPNRDVRRNREERLDRRRDPRVVALFDYLRLSDTQPDILVFEDVQFSSYTMQCQLWASLRTAAWLAFPMAHFECVPVSTLKKFATGHGGATKEMMAAALVKQYPKDFSPNSDGVLQVGYLDPLDDNAVDAIWLWLWARKNLGKMVLPLDKKP